MSVLSTLQTKQKENQRKSRRIKKRKRSYLLILLKMVTFNNGLGIFWTEPRKDTEKMKICWNNV